MKPLFLFLLLITTKVSFSQNWHLPATIAEAEKKGGAIRVLGSGGLFSSASPDFKTGYARFRWTIDPAKYHISGSVFYRFTTTENTSDIVFDLDDQLVVDSVVRQGKRLGFLQQNDKTVTINFPLTIAANQTDSLTIYYGGTPANNGYGSFTQRTHGNSVPVIWTLSEPYGARDWWPCRNGLDDKIDSIDIYLTHPAAYTASANGVPLDSSRSGDEITTHFRHRYPIATYLIGVAVTNYVSFSSNLSLAHGNLPVTTTVYPESLGYFQNNISPLYNALRLYDAHFGAYPFLKERYGQTQFGWGGGMEHQSNSFVTNADEYLMAHELAHQWFGDKITLGSWEDIWLNEGFATYLADIFYSETYHPENLSNIVMNDMLMATDEPSGSVWVDDTTDINRIFSNNLTYKKGGMLLRMLRRMLGDSAFFAGVNNYLSDSALQYQFAKTADLQRHLEAASGRSLTTFFDQWFRGKGFPSFTVKWNWQQDSIRFDITETTSDAATPLFATPLQLVFKNGSHADSIVVDVSKTTNRFTLPLSYLPDTVLIDPMQYVISKNNSVIRDTNIVATPPPVYPQLVLYPNPAHNVLNIRFKTADSVKKVSLNVVSAGGASVYKKSFLQIENGEVSIPVLHLAPGVYFVLIQDDTGRLIKKTFIRQ